MFKRMISFFLVSACGGMAVDSMPDGGVDGTHNPEYPDTEEKDVEEDSQSKWCIGCLAGVSVPRSLPFGYGLRPINETIGGKSLQFPACQGTQSSMPHACRTPTGNKVYFGAPPASWSPGRANAYWNAVFRVGAELNNAGWIWAGAHNTADQWDVGSERYKHTEILVKNDITNSPHPLFKLTLQGVQTTPASNIKTYLACEIQFDWDGPNGIMNNGGNCTGQCVNTWDAESGNSIGVNTLHRALMRCAGLGGDQLPIYQYAPGSTLDSCWAYDGYECGNGGGDGLLRKEWFPAGWYDQAYHKTCMGTSATACAGAFPSGGSQFLSGSALLLNYRH
jgi:hypothetical protein